MNAQTANNLGSLVTNLELQHSQKRDHIVPASSIYFQENRLYVGKDAGLIGLNAAGIIGQTPTELCHSQIAEKLGIPMAYYKRMQSENDLLLEKNINGWLSFENKKKYLLRTLQISPEAHGIARAFLSDRYNILDNYDVLLAALEAIKTMGVNVEVTKAEVTDSRMYLHVTCPEIEVEADSFLRQYLRSNDAVGNGIVSGFILTNSEVGKGTFEIRPRATIVKCNNGLIVKDDRFRKVHLGARMDEGEIKWSEQTKQRNYSLIISQTQDAIKSFLSKEYLGVMIEKIADAHKIILDNPLDTVQNVCKELSITEEHKRSILDFFLQDGDHRASGVFHAITKQAQNMGADMQYEVEVGAGEILPSIKKFDKPFSKN